MNKEKYLDLYRKLSGRDWNNFSLFKRFRYRMFWYIKTIWAAFKGKPTPGEIFLLETIKLIYKHNNIIPKKNLTK